MQFEIDDCLRYVVESEGSDLHVKIDSPPMARIHGELRPIEGTEPLGPEDTEAALRKLIDSDRTREEFAEDGEADFSYQLEGVSRFRVNAFRQRGAVSIVCRAIPFQVRTIEDLGLPPVIRTLADEQRGIILLTGTTGSGKSTTLAAMIDHINSNYPHHVITLEDPIEYLHRDKRSIINQREVGFDTQSFSRAMKRVLRQDPDVILVGEMRDEETVRTALSAAETGHLVLSTLHTLDATETINRIIDFFPPHLQQQARVMLAATLKGAISQRLVPTVGGGGRVAASEILVVTGRVQDLILNPAETGKISQVIAEGDYYGMQTFDQSLLKEVTAGNVAEETAMEYASSPHDFKLMLASAGRAASDLSQIAGNGSRPAPGAAYGSPPPSAPPQPPEPPQQDSGAVEAGGYDTQPAPAPPVAGSVAPGEISTEYGPPEPAPELQVGAPPDPVDAPVGSVDPSEIRVDYGTGERVDNPESIDDELAAPSNGAPVDSPNLADGPAESVPPPPPRPPGADGDRLAEFRRGGQDGG
jgi:twitching motility protein PilT